MKYDLLIKNNSTINKTCVFQKDFIVSMYEELVSEEVDKIEEMIKSQKNVLELGSFVNACAIVSPRDYLGGYRLTFDSEEEPPVIGRLS